MREIRNCRGEVKRTWSLVPKVGGGMTCGCKYLRKAKPSRAHGTIVATATFKLSE